MATKHTNPNTRTIYKVAKFLRIATAAQVDPREVLLALIEDTTRHGPLSWGSDSIYKEYKERFAKIIAERGERFSIPTNAGHPEAVSGFIPPMDTIRLELGGIAPAGGLPSERAVRKLLEAYAACVKVRDKSRGLERNIQWANRFALSARERWLAATRMEKAGAWHASQILWEKFFQRQDLGPYRKVAPHCPLLHTVHTPAVLIAAGQYDGQYHQTAWEKSRRKMGVLRTGARLP